MGEQKSWFQIIRWKLIITAIVGAGLFVVTGALGFPMIFRISFAAFAGFGFVVFVLLDAPPLRPLSGLQAGIAIAIFYLLCSGAFIVISMFLPQFSSQNEAEGIARKTAKYRLDPKTSESLAAMSRELSDKADKILVRLNTIRLSGGAEISGDDFELPPPPSMDTLEGKTPEEIIEIGKYVYLDYECYNCHKIGGKGGKKRGPKLDNIANLVTAAQLKDKIFNPENWLAEGYEKRKKDKMPDKYPDVMSDLELEALTIYLMTLNDASVDTPEPVFPPGYSVE